MFNIGGGGGNSGHGFWLMSQTGPNLYPFMDAILIFLSNLEFPKVVFLDHYVLSYI